MALTQRSRSVLYKGLTDMIEDEVAVGELLSYFPARDVEEPATKEFVALQTAELRVELAAMEARLTSHASAQMRATIQWTLGALVSVMALVIAMGFLQGP